MSGGMSISPFNAHPVSPETESRRARLVLAIAIIGIAATLLAYAASPGVRHAVGHAAHSVKGAVSRALDHDTTEGKKKAAPAGTTSTPARSNGATVTTTAAPATQKSP